MTDISHNYIYGNKVMLKEHEEQELFNRWETEKEAGKTARAARTQAEILSHFTPLVLSVANKMSGYNIDSKELISEGLLALSEAATRFDRSKGFRFSTFALSWITGMIRTYISKNYFLPNVCTNSTNRKMFFTMRRYIADYTKRTGNNEFTDELKQELAKEFGVDVERVEYMNLMINAPVSSLDEPASTFDDGNEMTRQELLMTDEDTQEDTLIEVNGHRFHKKLISTAMKNLNERERSIIEQQVLHDDERITLETIGEQFGISKERVRQIRDKATKKIEASVREQMKASRTQIDDLFA